MRSEADKQKAVITAIINAYHTTRLRETPVEDHIIRKPTVQAAFSILRGHS